MNATLHNFVKVTKVRRASWVGRDGEYVAFHLDKKSTGLRVSAIRWADGEAEVRLIEGDGRKDGFKTHRIALEADASWLDISCMAIELARCVVDEDAAKDFYAESCEM